MDEKIIHVPKNMFHDEYRTDEKKKTDVFGGKMIENKKGYEQFFWTQDTVEKLMESLKYTSDRCCLTTPSLAHAWYLNGENEVCLDIDDRFSYLPRYRYYDVRNPEPYPGNDFRIIILDPPYFVVPIEDFRRAVDVITENNYKTKIILGFLKREQKRLLKAFEPYKLCPTQFPLEYASIKPSKWHNFCLYSNIDLPGIKRKK
jgi:hypothetical protein